MHEGAYLMFQQVEWQALRDASSPPRRSVPRWLVLGPPQLADALKRAGLQADRLTGDGQAARAAAEMSREPGLGVLFAPGFDAGDAATCVERGLQWAELARAAETSGGWLWLMTRGALDTGRAEERVDPSSALLLTLGRAAFAEQPALHGGLLDVGADTGWLPGALHIERRQPVAWRDGALLGEKVSAAALSARATARARKTALIIGGAGGLGAALAAQQAAAGATPVLTGRMARPAEARLEYHQVDVRDRAAMQRVIAGRSFDLVVHAAGDLHLGSLARTPREAFKRVFAAKVDGTLALADVLEGHAASVVLLTSTSGVLPGQQAGLGAYAAANAFQDAFARRQRQRGLDWSSFCLPSVRGVGLSGRLAGASPSRVSAVPSLSLAEALDAIDGALGSEPAQRIVAPSAEPAAVSGSPEPAAPRPDRASLEATLRALLAQETSLLPDGIDEHRSFQSFGIDSLGALDLIRSIEERVGRRLSDTLLFEHETLAKLLNALVAGEGGPRSAERPAPAQSAQSAQSAAPLEFPVLPAQKTFYANQRFFPEMPGYVFLRADLRGKVSPPLLEAAIEVLFRRHPMLRVVFELRDSVLLQRQGTFAAPPLILRDAQPAQLDALEADFRNEIFSLDQGPLFRVALVRTGAEQASLLLHVHHIVADAWSGQLLLLELLELHRLGSEGRALELPALSTSFSDCVKAFEARAGEAEAARSFWREELKDLPPPLRLPFASDPEAVPRGPCHLHQVELDEPTTQALLERAKSLGCSPFELVFSAYALCLREWSGEADLVVRVAQARRDTRLSDVERVVGCFADSLPLRVQVPEQTELPTLLGRVREASLKAQQHAQTSSLELAGLGAPRGKGGPRGLTPAGFSFPDFKAPAQFGAVEIEAVRAGAATGFTQLGLIAWRFRGRLHLSWNFTEALFDPATIRRLALELNAKLSRLATEEPASGHQGLPSSSELLHERVSQALRAAAERPVVITPAASLTGAELEQRSEALAHALASAGAAPGNLVIVLARPGADAVTAVLGVLASGAGYVPIDPDYPDARIAQVALHSQAPLLVTTAAELPRVQAMPQLASLRVFMVGELPPSGVSKPLKPAAPTDLAYVMYTSGTTGEPKGVCVSHRAVSIFHDWVHDTFEVTSADRFIQTSSLSFGGSIRQIYSPLLAGAAVYPAPVGLTKDPVALAEFLEANAITIWNSVPSLWRKLLDALQSIDAARRPKLAHLRWILIGGEQVPASLVHEWRALYGSRHRIANLYGSTETVVNATAFEVPADFREVGQVPIGRPRSGSEVRLLDDARRSVAVGETGELYVGGRSLSSGYHRAPELTREAFVALPKENGPFYRTGDLARLDAQGNLQFLGRGDTQVKVRGNRVELAEIEAALESAAGVKAAIVVEHRDADRQWLVALVQPREGEGALDSARLRAHVASRLPAFMVPHRFEPISTFPLTHAGKVDRRALASRVSSQLAPVEPSGAGWSHTERSVARVWCEVLRVPSVERDDDFFALGGDSLIALDMLTRLEKQLGAMPRPVTLYSERTVARLARAIDLVQERAPQKVAAPRPDDEPFALAPGQVGFLLAERLNPQTPPVWCADLPGRGALDRARMTAALRIVVDRHELLRVVFEQRGLKTLQRARPLTELPLEWHDVTALPADAQARQIDEHFERLRTQSFDLFAAPGWSVAVFVTGPETFRCLIAVHHAIGDGWSVQLLGAELLAAYDGGVAFAPLSGTFRDVVQIHQQRAQQPFDAGLQFWRGQFESRLPRAVLPEGSGETESVLLSSAETAELREHARAARTTLHELVLTCLFRALRTETGQGDLTVGTALSGRDVAVPSAAAMFGCFTRALPVRARVAGDDWAADLDRVGRAFRTASLHAEVPIEQLAAAVRRESGAPLPGATFFLSLMDFRSLPQVQGRALQLDLNGARFHFGAAATGTQLMLGALAGDTLRLNAHGSAAPAVKRRLLDAVRAELVARSASPAQPLNAPLDAALVAYLPSAATLERALGSFDRELVRSTLFPGALPRLIETATTRLGRSGVVFLPHFAEELAAMTPESVAAEVANAVQIARGAGARSVSLAGMLPSWTGYGFAVARLLGGGDALTTGHAATVVAMAKTVERLLAQAAVPLSKLDVAVIGFGSIGQASLRLVLDVLGLPRSVTICERSAQLPRLAPALAALEERLGERPRVVVAEGGLPADLYACHLLLGASSEGGAIDVGRLRPGTCVVDDSLPSIADPAAASSRMRRDGDVLIVDGGKLDVGEIHRTLDVPLPEGGLPAGLDAFLSGGLPGCRAESLLIACDPGLKPHCGLVDPQSALAFWKAARRAKVDAASWSLAGRPIDPAWVVSALARLSEGLER